MIPAQPRTSPARPADRAPLREGPLAAGLVLCLVTAAFATIYITQPVQPLIAAEYGVGPEDAALTVAAVLLGITLANLPFGALADRWDIRPIVLVGGGMIAVTGLFCIPDLGLAALVAGRFVQGLFIPALTSCLAAHLARTVPADKLNLVMGCYVAATVVGGLWGRLLGGWLIPPEHWRWAFAAGSLLVAVLTGLAAPLLKTGESTPALEDDHASFRSLLASSEIWTPLAATYSSMFVFTAMFNYLPFYLSGPPFNAPVEKLTLLYLAYLAGVAAAPLAGHLAGKLGAGRMLIGGAAVFALAVVSTLWPTWTGLAASLVGVCLGHFAIHTSAAGLLNRRLSGGRGRANSLYILCYYLGAFSGVSAAGWAYAQGGWPWVAGLGLAVLAAPAGLGIRERRRGW